MKYLDSKRQHADSYQFVIRLEWLAFSRRIAGDFYVFDSKLNVFDVFNVQCN